MFKLLVVLAIVYIVLKVINTRAKFAEADARREAEDELTREEAVDVEAEVIETAAEDTEDEIRE